MTTLFEDLKEFSQACIFFEWLTGATVALLLGFIAGIFYEAYRAMQGNVESAEFIGGMLGIILILAGPIVVMRILYRIEEWYKAVR